MTIVSKNSKLGIICCCLLAGFSQTAQAHDCTVSDVAGKYGYTSSGSIVSPAVAALVAVGRVNFTEAGTFSGAQTTSIAGNLVDETVQGTFAVNADCTGTATVNVYHGIVLARTTRINLVWDDHARGVRAIFLTTGTAITITGRKMFGDD
jgi:hypothetical protein